MAVNIGDTVRVTDIPAKVIEQGEALGYPVSAMIGTEAKVTHTGDEVPGIAQMLGISTESVWIEAPTMPDGEFLLTPGEYELV